MILDAQGPLSLQELVDAVASQLERCQLATRDGQVYDDIQALATLGWITPLRADSRRFALTDRGRATFAST